MPKWIDRVLGRKTYQESNVISLPQRNETPKGIQPQLGSSGTSIYSGYYSEEYLQALTGQAAADIYDEMRRGDSRIKMILSAVKNPIKAAVWDVCPGEEDDESYKTHAEFVEYCLFKDQTKTFKDLLTELCSVVDFGHSVFEMVDKVSEHEGFGTFNNITLNWRSPRTFQQWIIDRNTGELKSLEQLAYGDLSRSVMIPGDRLMVLSLDKEGDNYEGISALRACYGAWVRKKLFLKLNAIGIERNAVPTPTVKFPPGFQGQTDEWNAVVNNLKALTSHQQNYFLYPSTLEIEFGQNNFDPSKVQSALDFENKEMTFAFLANFLELGSGGGSYALSFDLSDFFLGGLENISELICDTINKHYIPRLIKLNFGPQECYPKLTASGISDKAGKEFAEILAALANSKYIIPDEPLEASLRKRLGLPEISVDTQRNIAPINPFGGPGPQGPEAGDDAEEGDEPKPDPDLKDEKKELSEKQLKKKSFELAERNKPKKLIVSARDRLTTLMRESLTDIADDFVQDLAKAYRKAGKSSKVNSFKNIHPKGRNQYVRDLQDWLSEVGLKALNDVRKEIPKAKNVKLADFDKLPKKVQKRIKAQSQLMVDTQLSDLEKALYFKFTANADYSLGSDQLFEGGLQKTADAYVDGGSVLVGAANAAAEIVNESRNAFFFDDEVLQEVESFTFVNPAPVSDICQDLAGRTFDKNDPEAEQYFPPLHHNCKSYLVPNFVGSGKKIDKNGLEPSSAKIKESIKFSGDE